MSNITKKTTGDYYFSTRVNEKALKTPKKAKEHKANPPKKDHVWILRNNGLRNTNEKMRINE